MMWEDSDILQQIISSGDNINIKNAGIGESAVVISKLKRSIVVTADDASAQEMLDTLLQLGANAVMIISHYTPYSNSRFFDKNKLYDNTLSMKKIISGDADIVIMTADSINMPLPSADSFRESFLTYESGREYSFDNIKSKLTAAGYSRVSHIQQSGEYAINGDIVDIFAINERYGYRLDFFDDYLEKIMIVNNDTMEKVGEVERIEILPISIYTDIDDYVVDNMQSLMSADSRNMVMKNNLADNIYRIQNNQANIDGYVARDFGYSGSKIYNYIDVCNVIYYNDYIININISQNAEKNSLARKSFYAESNDVVNIHDDYTLSIGRQIVIGGMGDEYRMIDMSSMSHIDYLARFDILISDTKAWLAKGYSVIYGLQDEETISMLSKVIKENNINDKHFSIILSDIKQNINIGNTIYIGTKNFAHKKQAVKKSISANSYIPNAGEYVVHIVHGIGRCDGIVSMDTSGAMRDYYRIIYRNNSILYLPIENVDMLSLYGSADMGDVKLSIIGGRDFAKKTAKAMESIKDMAKELVQIYSQRLHYKRAPYIEDDYMYRQFEQTFSYSETVDQTLAIQDIERDMHSERIMDRLLCGDVGFGKTEVAYRAIFRAIMSGKQVAILSPTTVLSLQHYMNALQRFELFGLEIEMLNRFKKPPQVREILDRIKQGKVQIVSGTHKILNKNVEWNDLGLLILDEEHKFGVQAKEKIKQMKTNVDVLTLTATPIPRTLNMAMMKIRDISVLNTPPIDRKSIETRVLPYNIINIINAIKNEIDRQGQVLIVCNNIEKLYHFSSIVKSNISSDVRIEVAHGQMPEIQLENAVKRLYDNEIDIFLSTTIIENGVDLPNANTLIVLDSQMLGLAQMYQLRGRVGRSSRQAYAFFVYPTDTALTIEAAERLQAIASNTALGSGLKLAMRDLQIRGAGDLLGSKQSGHIANIGYDMYIRLLEQATAELSGEKTRQYRETKVDISIDSHLTREYIADDNERNMVISKISHLSTLEERTMLLKDMSELYGATPSGVIQLTMLSMIKNIASTLDIRHIIINKSISKIVLFEDCDKTVLHNIDNKKYDIEKIVGDNIIFNNDIKNTHLMQANVLKLLLHLQSKAAKTID